MPKFIQQYQCIYCSDLFSTYIKAALHEDECSYNPEAKKCGTCEYSQFSYGNTECIFKPEDCSSTYEFYDNNLSCPYHKGIKC